MFGPRFGLHEGLRVQTKPETKLRTKHSRLSTTQVNLVRDQKKFGPRPKGPTNIWSRTDLYVETQRVFFGRMFGPKFGPRFWFGPKFGPEFGTKFGLKPN